MLINLPFTTFWQLNFTRMRFYFMEPFLFCDVFFFFHALTHASIFAGYSLKFFLFFLLGSDGCHDASYALGKLWRNGWFLWAGKWIKLKSPFSTLFFPPDFFNKYNNTEIKFALVLKYSKIITSARKEGLPWILLKFSLKSQRTHQLVCSL